MINPIGPVPTPLDSAADFNSKAFGLLAQLPGFVTETNATADTIQINADILAAVLLAMAFPEYSGTSGSSITVGTGPKVFPTQTGKLWVPGQIVVASSGGNIMRGPVVSYAGASLTVDVTSTVGSGAFGGWSIGLTFDGLLLAKSGANADITSLLALASVPSIVQAAIDAATPVGTIKTFARTSPPAGYLVCPTAATNVSRTTYAALFAAIGTTWGAGDGSTTFGLPWFPADYAMVQASGNVGTQTVGQLLAHTHNLPYTGNLGGGGSGANITGAGGNIATQSTGGAANLAAGSRVLICIKF